MDRENLLAMFHRCLNTEEGVALMEDLKQAWGSGSVYHEDTKRMAYNAALLDCYRELEAFQDGRRLKEEVIVSE